MTSVVTARRGTAWPQGTREGDFGAHTLGPAASFLSIFVTAGRERPGGRQRRTDLKENKGGEMASQTEFAEPLHSLCDLRGFSALAPSALNLVRQKCEAGKAGRLKSSAPISVRLAHKGTASTPPLAPTSESGAGGEGGYTRQNGKEDVGGGPLRDTHRSYSLGPEISPFSKRTVSKQEWPDSCPPPTPQSEKCGLGNPLTRGRDLRSQLPILRQV